ncbi:MAG: hypothetical protein AAF968_25020 [Pseudomonadota bacterium]
MIRIVLMAVMMAGFAAASVAKANDVQRGIGIAETSTYRLVPGITASSRFYRDVLAPAEPQPRQGLAPREAAPTQRSGPVRWLKSRLLREDESRQSTVGRESLC